VYSDERVARFIRDRLIPVRLNVREQAADFQRFGERYEAQWTPTILLLDPDGTERHRIEGFVDADTLLAQLELGMGKSAFKRQDWKTAEGHYRTVAERHGGTDAAPEALYWAGVSRYKATGDASALADTARAFGERYQDSPWATKASVWKG
jgi:hypothetical protein